MSTEQITALNVTAKATKALETAVGALSKISIELTGNAALNESLLEQIAQGQLELNNLEEETNIAVRRQAVDLNLRVQENADQVLTDLLSQHKLARVTLTGLQQLVEELEATKATTEVVVDKAVSDAVADLTREHDAEILRVEANHAVNTAQLNATVTAKSTEIVFMQRQNALLEATITAEREARISMAEAASRASGVVVNTSGK